MSIKELLEIHRSFFALLMAEDRTYEQASAWSVYKHIEHVLLTNSSILAAIERGESPAKIEKRTFIGYVVLFLGFIPRGRAKAPKEVEPLGKSKSELQEFNQELISRLENLLNAPLNEPNKVIANHPYFGGLSKKQWIRFLVIHSRHHLKIIQEFA
jgi:hypothetical protein